jgi:putative membrane protein
MANERTYLAWLRTSVTLMSFGLVLNRFAAELGSVRRAAGVHAVLALPAEHVGVGMVGAGMVLILGAAVRYAQVRHGIDTGEYRPLMRAAWIIALAVLVGGVTCLVWMYRRS